MSTKKRPAKRSPVKKRPATRTTRGRAAKRRSPKPDAKKLGVILKKYNFQQAIPKSHLRPGMIIQFGYSGKYSNDPAPLVLVLNPRFLGKLHGINLNYCNYNQILKISKVVNQKIDQQQIRLKERFKMNSPYGFYHSQLKFVLRRLGKSIYRTYFYSGVKQPKLMDFKFNAPSGKQQLAIRSLDGKIQTIVQKMKTTTVKGLPERRSSRNIKTVNINDSKSVRPNVIQNVQNAKNVVRNVRNVKVVNTSKIKVISNVDEK